MIQIESIIEASDEQLYPHFADLEQFGALHPLIKSVKVLDEFCVYEINEPIKLIGNLALPNKYVAVVTADSCDKVNYKVRLPFGVTLTIDFSLVPSNSIPTILTETVVIKGFFPLRYILGVMIKKYHQMIHDKLKECYPTKE